MEAATKLFKPNIELIKKHLSFIVEGMGDYADGKIEIAHGLTPNKATTFTLDEVEKAAQFAVEKNAQGENIYLVGSLLDPDIAPFGRSRDTDFYATSVVWCDIDRQVTPEELKQKYAALPPSLVVITGRTPHLRTHLWWKLQEPCTDAETLREALEGVQIALGGDRAVKNVTSLMRLGGTVAWPKKSGRVTEYTEVITPANATQSVNIERLISNYPATGFYHETPQAAHAQEVQAVAANPFEEKIADGRDKYMSDMVYAAIVNLTGELGRWPTPQEVFEDAWPTYAKKVMTREGKTLDQEGRGERLMQSKIKSKLWAFERGKMRGLESPALIAASHKAKQRQPLQMAETAITAPLTTPTGEYDPETGEVLEATVMAKILPFKWAGDVQPQIDANDFVEGMLGTGQFSVVYGESNCGKTFFMTDLAFHVAMGRKWRDRRVDKGGVVYVALEGSFGLSNRIAAFRQENEESANMPFAVVTTQINFLDNNPDGNLALFIETVKHVAQKVGGVKLVVVDTLARAISGGDENSGQDMGLLVAHADLIRQATGAHVCFVHHSGKDRAKGARGHSSLRAAVDTEIEVSRQEDDNFSTVKVVKQRDMEMAEDMFFGLKSVCIGVNRHNEEVKSCVVNVIEQPETTQKDRGQRLNDMQQFVYDALIETLISYGKERTPRQGMSAVKCVTYDQLADTMQEMGYKDLYDKDGKNNVKSVTNTVRASLRRKGIVGYDKGFIWVINKN